MSLVELKQQKTRGHAQGGRERGLKYWKKEGGINAPSEVTRSECERGTKEIQENTNVLW